MLKKEEICAMSNRATRRVLDKPVAETAQQEFYRVNNIICKQIEHAIYCYEQRLSMAAAAKEHKRPTAQPCDFVG